MDWETFLGVIATAAGLGALLTGFAAAVAREPEERTGRIVGTVVLVLVCAVSAGLA